jgi:EAL domain-containing protein (putative c-di-GMP-specific phosphodiesterase class I)
MSPAEFVAAAEETGLITRIGNLVLNRALSDWSALNTPSTVPRHVSVNVSARQVRDPDFVDSVRAALGRHHVEPSQVILEVTETILVANDDRAWSHLSHLRDDGVRIAIDDFGTGYASMSYLRQTALDVLKLDQSFLDGVAMERSEILLASITDLARDLGLQTIAEGVRDASARDLLLRVGCEYGQGFLYAPALPVDQAASWYGPAP